MLVDTLLAQLEGFDVAMQEKEYRSGRVIVAYQVTTPTGVQFDGDTFSLPSFKEWDQWDTICALLFWICLRPGDTDEEYFADYSPEQMEWAESIHCEIASFLFCDDQLSQGNCHTLEDDPEESDFAGNVWLLHEISYTGGSHGEKYLTIIPMRTRYTDSAPMWIEQSQEESQCV